MLIAASSPRRLGVPADNARVRFGPDDPHSQSPNRSLLLDGSPAFSLSFWCGTCPFLFERRSGANETQSGVTGGDRVLDLGLDEVDDRVIDRFATLLEEGNVRDRRG
ncbi:hypothetical protein [Gordonia sp. MP11Mi]